METNILIKSSPAKFCNIHKDNLSDFFCTCQKICCSLCIETHKDSHDNFMIRNRRDINKIFDRSLGVIRQYAGLIKDHHKHNIIAKGELLKEIEKANNELFFEFKDHIEIEINKEIDELIKNNSEENKIKLICEFRDKTDLLQNLITIKKELNINSKQESFLKEYKTLLKKYFFDFSYDDILTNNSINSFISNETNNSNKNKEKHEEIKLSFNSSNEKIIINVDDNKSKNASKQKSIESNKNDTHNNQKLQDDFWSALKMDSKLSYDNDIKIGESISQSKFDFEIKNRNKNDYYDHFYKVNNLNSELEKNKLVPTSNLNTILSKNKAISINDNYKDNLKHIYSNSLKVKIICKNKACERPFFINKTEFEWRNQCIECEYSSKLKKEQIY